MGILSTILTIKSHYNKFGKEGVRFYFKKRNSKDQLISLNILDYPNPIFLRNGTSDISVFNHVIRDREYDLDYGKVSTIIDCGANIGLTSVFLYNKYPNAKIIAVEPESSNFELLKNNTAHYKNIECVKKGIWHSSVHLEVLDNGHGKWGFTTKEVGSKTETSLDAISIDSIMDQYGLKVIDLLKIDIEGSEKELFEKNYDKWLPKVKVLVIELHDHMRPGCAENFFRAISKYKFEFKISGRHNLVFIMSNNQ
jgi:FkbM family methyltransferase